MQVKKPLSITELALKANDIRVDIIKMLEESGKSGLGGHSGGPLGLAEIFTALYFDVLKHDPHNPEWEQRDLLLLSNGHCTPVRYAAMAEAGYFDKKELMTLRKFGTRLQGHPERLLLPGLETTSGPLGCGLSQACGMSLAMRMNKDLHRYVYVVMSDGEQNEGNIWEAAMLANKYRLSNIIAITDRNNIQIEGNTEDVMPLDDLKEKWESFGWHVIEIDGNNIEAIIDACAMARAVTDRPSMIIAMTVPGKDVGFMEGDFTWHGVPPSPEEAKEALQDLRVARAEIGAET